MTTDLFQNVADLSHQFSAVLVARNIIHPGNVDAAVIATRDVLKEMFTSDDWKMNRDFFKSGMMSASDFLELGVGVVAKRLGAI